MIYTSIDYIPRHPSQLYEAFLEGILLFLILLYIFNKNYSINKEGRLSAIFLIFYGIFRFAIEFLREPDYHIGLFYNFFTMGQILCIPLVLIGFFILLKNKTYA
jgi:phosphatidylglycerol:prolipoprotein diacylglycerol transferase